MPNNFDIVERECHEALKADFDKYYHSTIYPFLQNSERIRLKFVKRFWFLVLISLAVLPMIAILLYFVNSQYDEEFNVNVLAFALAISIFVCREPYEKYRQEVKNDTMGLFIKFFEGFTYHPEKGLTDKELTDSRIFPAHHYVIADDCFSGMYNGVHIRVCEEILEREYFDRKGRRKKTIVFRGIAVELDMNKNFSGQTIVVKDSGIFNVFKGYKGMERVKLEDVVFEKKFEVFSTNQVEARYILTTSFMERLLKLLELYQGKKIEASFYKNKILIAVDTRSDMFEPCAFFRTNLNKERIDLVFEQMWTIFSIINTLKLNTKLGL